MYTDKLLSVAQLGVVKIGRCLPRIPVQFCTLFYTALNRRSTVSGIMPLPYCSERYGSRSRSATDQMKLAGCW